MNVLYHSQPGFLLRGMENHVSFLRSSRNSVTDRTHGFTSTHARLRSMSRGRWTRRSRFACAYSPARKSGCPPLSTSPPRLKSKPFHREAAYRNLGNLTLLNLSVNRQAQHYGFKEKRDLLIANTNLQLSVPLVSRSDWNEAAIAERGQQLTGVALRLWPGPRA